MLETNEQGFSVLIATLTSCLMTGWRRPLLLLKICWIAFGRSSKYSGAWMSKFRSQSNLGGYVDPVIVNCCNFLKSDPCLLGMDEVRTLFHEFGHGLHGLLSKVRYPRLSGTNVKQDFVELPSQIMEHWALESKVLKSYAIHQETSEPIPDELIPKLRSAQTFNQGFATTEYLAAVSRNLPGSFQ